MRRVRAAQKAEKARLAAIARLADVTIERRRVQQARLNAGLPISGALKPKLPANVPRPGDFDLLT